MEKQTYDLSGNAPVALVDDVQSDIKFFEVYYKKSKIKNPLINFSSGIEFLAYLDEVERGVKEMPALVFLDINMPKMSGHETLAIMKKRKPFKDVPVVLMLTSSTRDADKKSAKEGGAAEYFVKPLDGSAYVQFFNSLVA